HCAFAPPCSSTASSRFPFLCVFFLLPLRPPPSPLFPYTTLFRSRRADAAVARARTDGLGRRRGRERGLCPERVVRHHRRDSKGRDRKSTRLNSSHQIISYAVFCLKKKTSTSIR